MSYSIHCITVEREGLWLWLSLWLYTFFCSSEFDRRPPLHNQSQKIEYISAPTSLRTHTPPSSSRDHTNFIGTSLLLRYIKEKRSTNKNECNWIQLKKQRDIINSIATKTVVERIYQSTRIIAYSTGKPTEKIRESQPVASSIELNLGAQIIPIHGKREEEEEGVLCGNKSNLRKKYLSRNGRHVSK